MCNKNLEKDRKSLSIQIHELKSVIHFYENAIPYDSRTRFDHRILSKLHTIHKALIDIEKGLSD